MLVLLALVSLVACVLGLRPCLKFWVRMATRKNARFS